MGESSKRAGERVLVVTTSFPASAGDAAGHFVAAEAEELALAGHEVHVVCPGRRTASPQRVFPPGVHLHPIGSGVAFGWPGAGERLRRAPWRVLSAARFVSSARHRVREIGDVDRVIAHWLVPSAWPIAGSADNKARLRVVLHGADVRLVTAMPAVARRKILRDTLERAERIDFAAHSLRDALIASLDERTATWLRDKSCVRPPLIRVEAPPARQRLAARAQLHRSVTPGSVTPTSGTQGRGHDRKLVAVVGRLVKGKRAELAARAVARLGAPATLVFVGDGPERAALGALCAELGVDARFTGQLERPEAIDTIAACDVLLHPSALEAAPSVVREARVLGIKVVACRVGDIPRWAERDSSILTADATPEALAAALSSVT